MDGGGGRGTPKIKGDGTDLKNNFFGNFSENFLEDMDQREGGVPRSLLPPLRSVYRLRFRYLSNLQQYDRGNSFPVDCEPNRISFSS